MFSKTALILLLSISIRCSVVLDAMSQSGVYIADYCPKMKYCPEGAHIMCMYYNPNRVMGPRCRNARNVSMTPVLANKMLDVSNAVRSKIARGKEKGKNGVHLPRGYGMFRLKWDSELATFAQVLANQCVLRHDLCRATKKFPDPGQTAGLVRFSVPDWNPVSKSGKFSAAGLNDEKLLYATTQSLKSWYGQKSFITVQMLTNYPDWTKDPNNQNGRLYLEMIYGPATHMGCGISAYTEYAFYDNDAPLNYNSVQVICNYSARPRNGSAVYNTVPPSDSNSPFNSCGCPAGSMEDDDCLCLEIEKEPDPPNQKTEACPTGMNCDPTVVLLPIFTVEDAPPEKLITPESLANTSVSRMARTKIIDSFEELFYDNVSENKLQKNVRESQRFIDGRPNAVKNDQKQRSASHNSKSVTVRSRHFDKKPNEPKHYEEQTKYDVKHSRRQTQSHILKPSVFAKTPRFELPGTQNHFLTSIKRDVVPRKDFSVAKKLVNKYLYDKNSIILHEKTQTHSYENTISGLNDIKSVETRQLNNDLHTYLHLKVNKNRKSHHDDVHFHDILTTETVLNTAEQIIINQKQFLNDFNQPHDFNRQGKNTVTDESDKKFMALLDTLEQEVKHVELREKEKQIFDAKIKKIYGKVVGKPSNEITITGAIPVENVKKSENRDVKRNKYNDTFKNENRVPKVILPLIKLEYKNLPDTDQANTYNGHNVGNDFTENYQTQNLNDIITDDFAKNELLKDASVSKAQVDYDRRDVSNTRRHRNSIRQIDHNQIDSYETVRYRTDNGYKGRRTYINYNRNNNDKLKHRSNSLDYKFRNKNYDAYEDPLSAERRKYYQDKLESVERKLQEARHRSNRKEAARPRHMRTMRNNVRTDNQMNSVYTSGRARFLHGY